MASILRIVFRGLGHCWAVLIKKGLVSGDDGCGGNAGSYRDGGNGSCRGDDEEHRHQSSGRVVTGS
jgi:hypothetical protein